MNDDLTYAVLQKCVDKGLHEIILCAGSRNSSFVQALRHESPIKIYYWPEERSGAFFALGRARLTQRPVAIVTTSGTAAAELFPATMEAYYSGTPLILITADRPRRFRGSGAPQSAEQLKLFGPYAKVALDIEGDESFDLEGWDRMGPLHLNICFEEPQKQPSFRAREIHTHTLQPIVVDFDSAEATQRLDHFLAKAKNPLAIVSTLRPDVADAAGRFLQRLGIPAMVEAISGLWGDPRIASLALSRTDKVLEAATQCGYPIDAVLRIGGVPTHRIWRDLEYCKDTINVLSLSEQSFSGLSWSRGVVRVQLDSFLSVYEPNRQFNSPTAAAWLAREHEYAAELQTLFDEEPLAEASLVHSLSTIIPNGSHIYLGNSLPIREWDMAAARVQNSWRITASRGVNGIDGQISAFLGLSSPEVDNWGIFGDLTALYDLAGCWVLPQLESLAVNIVIINNGGGKFFERFYSMKEMLNEHRLSFESLANMWNLEYVLWHEVPNTRGIGGRHLFEILPNPEASARFWTKYTSLGQHYCIV